jgi:hypothetical protein
MTTKHHYLGDDITFDDDTVGLVELTGALVAMGQQARR